MRIVDGGEHASAGDDFTKPLAFADIVESSNKGLILRTDDSLLLGYMWHGRILCLPSFKLARVSPSNSVVTFEHRLSVQQMLNANSMWTIFTNGAFRTTPEAEG